VWRLKKVLPNFMPKLENNASEAGASNLHNGQASGNGVP
jgi:hypothetical protein